MGNICKSMADSCQCMTKTTTIKKKKEKNKSQKREIECFFIDFLGKEILIKNHLKHISVENPRTMSFTGRCEDSRTPPLNY